MRFLYLLSVWIHVIAATLWVGGLFFIVLVVVPWLRSGVTAGSMDAGAFLRDTGERFRVVAWVCFALVFVTGVFNLWMRGVRFEHLMDVGWWTAPLGSAVGLKLLAFLLVIVASLVHDFGVGPAATAALREDPRSPRTTALRRQASLLGRLNGVLALVLVALGVVIVRGWPW